MAAAAGFAVVREYVGHGIGTAMHEDPRGAQLRRRRAGGCGSSAGMVLAIEPMVNAGTRASRVLGDGWTVVTADGRRSAHFEHTVAVTDARPRGPDPP